MLVGLLESPDLFIDHIRRYTNSLTTQMIFGFRTTSIDDPKLVQLFSVSVVLPKRSMSVTNLILGL
jgi:hypothetical protein